MYVYMHTYTYMYAHAFSIRSSLRHHQASVRITHAYVCICVYILHVRMYINAIFIWIYFSNYSCKVPGIVGIVRVVSEAEPDQTAFDPSHKLFDPKSDKAKPRWFGFNIQFIRKMEREVSLHELKKHG